MYRCPFCANYSYDWNKNDSVANKEKIIDDIREHFKSNHPEELKTKPVDTEVQINRSK